MAIILLIFGVIALAKGEFNITRHRRVSGGTGRLLGVVMLVGAGLPFILGPSWEGLPLLAFIVTVGIGLATAERVEPPVSRPIDPHGPPHAVPGPNDSWSCSACGGYVRRDATLCKHCKRPFVSPAESAPPM